VPASAALDAAADPRDQVNAALSLIGRGAGGQHGELQPCGAALDAHLAAEEIEKLKAGIGKRIGDRRFHGVERKDGAV
jgi:hypothetical protein